MRKFIEFIKEHGVIGDFNNVEKSQDRIRSKMVMEVQYVDLQNMMNATRLCEMDSIHDYFTWFNKHTVGTIYSLIEKLLGNLEWFQKNMDAY